MCGGRDFEDKALLYKTLDNLCIERGCKGEEDQYGNWMPKDITIIHGAAKGADSLADDWAIVNWVPIKEYPADWDKYGKKAGTIRNQQMLDEAKPDLVVAFPTERSRGTWHMVRIAREAGVEVIVGV